MLFANAHFERLEWVPISALALSWYKYSNIYFCTGKSAFNRFFMVWRYISQIHFKVTWNILKCKEVWCFLSRWREILSYTVRRDLGTETLLTFNVIIPPVQLESRWLITAPRKKRSANITKFRYSISKFLLMDWKIEYKSSLSDKIRRIFYSTFRYYCPSFCIHTVRESLKLMALFSYTLYHRIIIWEMIH